MKCPTDGSRLQPDKAEDHTGYGCVSCKGSWLPKSYIDSIQYTKNFDPQTFFNELTSKANEKSHSACPSGCGVLSVVTDLQGIRYCSSCSGVWFERNALTEMLRRYSNKDESLTAASLPNATMGFFDIIGALFK